MNKSDLFSYLSAFVTIVLAVALGDMIQSTHRLIRARRRVKWDVIPLIFGATVALTLISEFFSLWGLFAISEVTLPRLLWMLTVPTLFALLAYSALPDDVPGDGLDLGKFYSDERRTWVIILGLATMLDVVRMIESIGGNRKGLIEFATFVLPALAMYAVALLFMWIGRSRHWDAAGVVILAAATIFATIGWTISIKS